jgi:hypothetical protein
MSCEKEIEAIESEWAKEDGFFWRIRQGHFVSSDFSRALNKVSAIAVSDDDDLPRRIVSLLWYVPLFMQWQVERVQANKGDLNAYASAVIQMTNEVERILGVP